MSASAELDNRVRLHIYERFVADGAPPTAGDTAAALGIESSEAEQAYLRLAEGHVLILAPNTTNVWAANPLCATPSAFRVQAAGRAWWGICIWDALGIPAMFGTDGRVSTWCPDCSDPLEFVVCDGTLEPVEAVVHFAVPAARWWENIAFT